MTSNRNTGTLVVVIALLSVVMLAMYFGSARVEKVGPPEFERMIADPAIKVEKVQIRDTEHKIYWDVQTADGPKHYYTRYPGDNLDRYIEALSEAKVDYETLEEPWYSGLSYMLLLFGLPIGLIILFYFFMIRSNQSAGGQAMNFGRSRAKLITDNRPKVTFADVAGIDEARDELDEVIDFLSEPKKFRRLGAKIPKGVLLVGPPGCGKTLLARAIAGEADVPFFYMSGSDFVEMFVGVGASRVRDLFDQAKKQAPCLVFIDEIDAVGRQRGAGLGGGHDEREQTLNQLLVEMDGFDANNGVIIIAATNRPDVLDPALLRPGRFDRQIIVDQPDVNGRKAILDVHAQHYAISKKADLMTIARRTPGFSGADLANLINEAALLAARLNRKRVMMVDLEEAIDRILAGPAKKSRVMSDKELKNTAYHEVGHALVAYFTDGADPVHKISILPRGRALGYTLQLPEEDQWTMSRKQLLGRMRVLLGGRAAEELVFNEKTTGASNDFQKSTGLARALVKQYGMSEKLGTITYGRKEGNVFLGRDLGEQRDYSEQVAYEIDKEVQQIVGDCYDDAMTILKEHRQELDAVSEYLIEHEVIDGDTFEALIKGEELPVPPPAPDMSSPADEAEKPVEKPASGKSARPEPA